MNRRLCQQEREHSLCEEAGLWRCGAMAGVRLRVTFPGGDGKGSRVVSVGDDPRKVCPGQGGG